MTPNRNQEQKNWFYFIAFVLSRNSLEETIYDLNTFKPVEDPGEKPGSFATPPLLEGAKKKFLRPPPAPSESLDPPMQTLTESVYLPRNVKSFIFGRQTNIFIWSIFSKTAKGATHEAIMRPRTFFFKVPKEKI